LFDLLKVESQIQELKEMTLLVNRAKGKLEGVTSEMVKKDSPLSTIKFILKANKRRPDQSYYIIEPKVRP
jgi:hypothetical protein